MWTTYTAGDYQPDEPRTEHKPNGEIPVGTEIGQGLKQGAQNNAMTNITGLYAFGEVNFAYHGATRLGANALLSCIFDGLFCGLGVANYVRDVNRTGADELPQSTYDRFVKQEEDKSAALISSAGSGDSDDAHNGYIIGKEMGEEMTAASTVVKTEARLGACIEKLAELRERYTKVKLSDTATWTNQTLSYTRAVGDMLILAEAIAIGGKLRKESRGSHYRTDYLDRDDANFWKTSIARYNTQTGQSEVAFEPVRGGLVELRARTYGSTEAKSDAKKDDKKETAGAG
jgi:succinate dehydrogenase / fumarate reductase flavoprotein subunit